MQGKTFEQRNVSQQARNRLFKLTRMALAAYEQYRDPLSVPSNPVPVPNPETGTGSKRCALVLGLRQIRGSIRVFPVFGPDAGRLITLMNQAPGGHGLYYTTDQYAFGRVAIFKGVASAAHREPYTAGRDTPIEHFWHEITRWLIHYRRIPLSWFHLFLGEISFRFHNRSADLLPLVLTCLKQTSMQEINSMNSE